MFKFTIYNMQIGPANPHAIIFTSTCRVDGAGTGNVCKTNGCRRVLSTIAFIVSAIFIDLILITEI